MIPKRALSAIVTTVFALALLLSFKTPESPGLASSTSAGSAIIGRPTTTAAPVATAAPASTAAPVTGSGDTTTGESGQTTTTPTATPAPTQDTTAKAASTYADGTVTGQAIQTRFGTIQVQVTIAGGQITDVAALQLPSGDRHSARISQAAEPILRQEALSAQSANIDLLSGATYTSDAYAQSLQSALDKATA